LSSEAGLPDGLFSNQKYQFWVNFGGTWTGMCWCILWPLEIFYGHSGYFMTIWVHFAFIWYVFSPVLVYMYVPRKIWQPRSEDQSRARLFFLCYKTLDQFFPSSWTHSSALFLLSFLVAGFPRYRFFEMFPQMSRTDLYNGNMQFLKKVFFEVASIFLFFFLKRDHNFSRCLQLCFKLGHI
jgi:hypothetical protein